MDDRKEQEDRATEFKVEDRRHFDQEGNIRSSASQAEETSNVPNEPPPTIGSQPKTYSQPDFMAILFPYIHSTLVYLGELQDPVNGKISENLEGAHQMIDILELLQVKTKGNLSREEEHYLETALFDLRMQYVQKTKLVK